jgi:hypothetical protein
MGHAAPRVNRKNVPFLAGWPSRSSQLEIDGERHVKRASMVRRTENQRKPGLAGGTSARTKRALSSGCLRTPWCCGLIGHVGVYATILQKILQ